MVPILTLSVIALALIVERIIGLWWRYRLDEEGFLKGIMHALDQQDFPGALKECSQAENHPLGRVLQAGLLKAHRSDREIERAMEEEMLRTVPQVRRRINYLATFGNKECCVEFPRSRSLFIKPAYSDYRRNVFTKITSQGIRSFKYISLESHGSRY